VTTEEQVIEVISLELRNTEKKLGFLLICEPGADEDRRIELLSYQAKVACILELQKREELLENKRQYRDAFLFDLLYGNIEESKDIISAGEIWGWNLNLPQTVTVFEIEDFEPYSEDIQLVKLIFDIVHSVLQQQDYDKRAILMQKDEEVVLILPINHQNRRDNQAYMNMLLNQIKAQAEARLNERKVRIGVGRDYAEPSEIYRSYQEAKVALKLGYLLQGDDQSPFFIDLGVERILYNHDLQELKEFYRETLEELEQYDKSQKNELMETLESFIFHRCDLKKTADALFLHKNTIRYRLKKVEEILKINMEDFNEILFLMIAFKIKYLKKL
jgi:sugar diacid utilization regulator